MRPMKNLAVLVCVAGLLSPAYSQSKATAQVAPADAANHIGQTATVCGTVVGEHMSRYGVGDRGRPITLDLDKPESNPVFHAVLFSKTNVMPDQLKATYEGKQVCVTGKITQVGTVATIMASDPSQFQIQAAKAANKQ
jgi:hypothetical protein